MSRNGDGEYEFIETLCRKLYLNKVIGKRGGAIMAAALSRQDVSQIQGKANQIIDYSN
jgi:hypothetical protein